MWYWYFDKRGSIILYIKTLTATYLLQASDSSMNQDKDLKVEVRRGKEKKVKAPF